MSMDRSIYVATSGVKQTMDAMSTSANNLANVSTTGFRAQIESYTSVPVTGEGLNTRAMAVSSTVSSDFKPGPLQPTDNPLDIAVQNEGWIAVTGKDGKEAYTRNGALVVEQGILKNVQGLAVRGDGGPIKVPTDTTLMIGADGTISGTQAGINSTTVQVLGRIKLVNPPTKSLERGEDGLFRTKGGGAAAPDAKVKLVSGALEGSNVNPVEEMVNMISLAREFEMHTKMLQTMDTQTGKADQLLTLT
ncbi:flagellar basal body rod protein FlgF [Candidatus Methylospira mobilis]|nr:flagellar basal body rod protein FlgF [Candidatus Methylospira mobilis]